MLNPNPDALAGSEDVNSCAQGILMRLMEVGRLVSTPAIPLPDSIKRAAWANGRASRLTRSSRQGGGACLGSPSIPQTLRRSGILVSGYRVK